MAMDDKLRRVATELVWWQPPETTLAQPRRFLAQVMNLGTWDQLQIVKQAFGWDVFQDALRNAAPGWLDCRSWALWHQAFGWPVPPLPKRSLT